MTLKSPITSLTMSATFSCSIAVGMLCIAFATCPAAGQQLITRIDNPDQFPEEDEFGVSVAMIDDLAIIGAWIDTEAGGTTTPTAPAGAAYIFRKVDDQWVKEAKLMPDASAVEGGFFGNAVGLSASAHGDFVVVGAPLEGLLQSPLPNTWHGAAYIFRHNGSEWVREQKLEPSDSPGLSFFGAPVAASGDFISVGAPNHRLAVGNAGGALYIYQYFPGNDPGERWVETVTALAPPDLEQQEQFGGGLAMDAQRSDPLIVVGARKRDLGTNSGAAYIYRFVQNEWILEQRLDDLLVDSESNPILGDRTAFGSQVSIQGESVIVGCAGFDADNVERSGAAFVFTHTGGGNWIWEDTLTAPDPEPDARFGSSLAVSGDLALVATQVPRAAHLFRNVDNQWLFTETIPDPGIPFSIESFGPFAIHGSDALIGAYRDTQTTALRAGAVYYYRIFNSPIGENITTNPVDSATGESPAIITFAEVLTAGATTIEITTEAPPIPSGFKLSEPEVFYDIQTTATFDGDITICITYDPTNVPDPEVLQLRHHNGTDWIDITTTRHPETSTICGETSSLSPFAIFQPLPATDPVTLLMELIAYVASVNIHHGIQNSLDAKLDAALSALESVSHNDRPAAVNALQAFINHTQAQSGNHIPPEVATELIARAQAIIALLEQ